jgi:group I intron endonuclease
MAKVYISGQITGLNFDEAFKNFEDAEKEVKELGGVPVNPMKLDHKVNADWYDFMEKDIAALLRCDGIYMLKNWGESKGAKIEHNIAVEMGIKIFYEESPKCCIYRIISEKTGFYYIGSTKDYKKRIKDHKKRLKANKHHSPILQNYWNKYGENDITFSVLCLVDNPKKLIDIEQEYLDTYNPKLNILKKAGNTLGYKFSEEHNQKTRERLKGNKHALGLKHSKETKLKISEINKGNKNTLGYRHTKEAKDKMSLSQLKRDKKGLKLTKNQYSEIKKMYESGYKQKEIAKKFNISFQHVSSIVNNKIKASENV